ncbi:hypothetical protein [Chengkuizengella marina]|uniref:Uncharacterized protein n=1 Tax=Chengkuizengella marina TaxID=2507566 RepID=A0A6N9PVR0_9BACL|nr:hypothetical protein [Chengkuizengella marina]NBI27621.1 hypothetical protein [Chengkuizengella marina]
MSYLEYYFRGDMMPYEKDLLVLLLIVVSVFVWFFFLIRRWLRTTMRSNIPLHEASEPKGKAISILEKHGYDVIAGKLIVPIQIHIDGSNLSSRYYIDYIATKDNEDYIVLLAKHRQDVNWKAGSSVRDHFFNYAILYDKIKGIIYVDLSNNTIKKIVFQL